MRGTGRDSTAGEHPRPATVPCCRRRGRVGSVARARTVIPRLAVQPADDLLARALPLGQLYDGLTNDVGVALVARGPVRECDVRA